ncbi:unnamed protein product [Phytophthora fragariaefolia]|uniref:Unnamed protein product n=1 Tax=Phytophthora fragariaefolia TaxID=1490495 RepID=A0A9W6YBP6_9STRA|nr:unnamed protein product [Phytophthora fragariaefolia]
MHRSYAVHRVPRILQRGRNDASDTASTIKSTILKLCTNAHAWGGTLTNSDHKLVTADFNLRDVPRRRFQTHVARDEETRLARNRLYYDEDARTDYQRCLAAALQDDAETLSTASPQDRWDRILRHAYTSAEDSVGYEPALSKGCFANPQLKTLSYLQQQLRLEIYMPKFVSCARPGTKSSMPSEHAASNSRTKPSTTKQK